MNDTQQTKIQRGKNYVFSGISKDNRPCYFHLILTGRKIKLRKISVPNTVDNSILLGKSKMFLPIV